MARNGKELRNDKELDHFQLKRLMFSRNGNDFEHFKENKSLLFEN